MKKLLLVSVLISISQFGFSQVGINTTSPDAQLDIRSSNQLTPANTDGILIPKIDAFPLTSPTAAQQGMMLYLTTLSLGKPPGFYYWDNTGTPQWKPISSSIPNGTTTGNTMYWNGTTWVNNSSFLHNDGTRVGVNTATPSSTFTVKQDGIGITQENSTGTSQVGFFTGSSTAYLQTHSNTDLYFATNNGSAQMALQKVTGNLGIGNTNPTTKLYARAATGTAVVTGEYVTPVDGSEVSVFNAKIAPTATTVSGKLFGLKNDLVTANSIEFSGVQNTISGNGTGLQYGINNQFTSTANTARYGLYNSFNASAATNIGVQNELLGSGIKFGMYNNIVDSNNSVYGIYNEIKGNGNDTRSGNSSFFTGIGTGDWIGNEVSFDYFTYSGATGKRFGYRVAIPPSVGGAEHYGVYSYAGDLTRGYSAYLSGRVSIGSDTTLATHYTLPLSRGTNGQIMQTDGSGNVTWQTPAALTGWSTTGNASTNPATHFLGTTDNVDFVFKRFSIIAGKIAALNTSLGVNSLLQNPTGTGNTAFGRSALQQAATAMDNNAVGNYSLLNNHTGSYNNALGNAALNANTTSGKNVAVGNQALYSHGYSNGQVAYDANNVAVGFESMYLNNPTTVNNGVNNTAVGALSMRANTIGYSNTAVGIESMRLNDIGSQNVAVGRYAMYNQVSGSNNTCIGSSAYPTSSNAVSNYTGIGYNVGGSGSLSNMVELGNTFVTAIRAQVTGITAYSDRRIKNNIKENVPGLQFITKLRPVTYNLDIHKQNQIIYKDKKGGDGDDWEGKYDIEKITQTGFIAQEVAEVAKATGYDFNGVNIPDNPADLYTVNYTQFVMPLVKSVQEQQEIIEIQIKKIQQLEKVNEEILKRLEKLEKE